MRALNLDRSNALVFPQASQILIPALARTLLASQYLMRDVHSEIIHSNNETILQTYETLKVWPISERKLISMFEIEIFKLLSLFGNETFHNLVF